MATVICPNCGAAGLENSICEFCGTSIRAVKQEKKGRSNNKSKKFTSDEINTYLSKVSAVDALSLAKKSIQTHMQKASKQAVFQAFWEYITPIDEKIKLLSFQTKLCYVPFYLYTFAAEVEEEKGVNLIKTLRYIGFAGDNLSYPLDAELDFSLIENISNYEYDPKPNAKIVTPAKFVKDKKKIWESAYGKKAREKYKHIEEPDIKPIFLPFYVITVSLPLSTSGAEIIEEEIVIDYKGELCSNLRSDILSMFAKYYLGANYFKILENKKVEYEQQKKQVQESKKRASIEAQKKADKIVLICTVRLIQFLLVALIVGMIFWFYWVFIKSK